MIGSMVPTRPATIRTIARIHDKTGQRLSIGTIYLFERPYPNLSIAPKLWLMRNPPRFASRVIRERLRELGQAQTYSSWREIANDLDRLEGADIWTLDDARNDYDYLLHPDRLQRLRPLPTHAKGKTTGKGKRG